MDKIVYLVTDHGVDGRERESIVFASFDAEDVNIFFDSLKYPNYYSRTKRIIDTDRELKRALTKLDGVHRLVLGIEQRELPIK